MSNRRFQFDFLKPNGRGFLTRLWTFLFYMGRLSLYTWKQLVKDKCLTSASALAFATLTAIIPVATIAFSLYRAFGGVPAFERDIRTVIKILLTAPSVTQQQTVVPQTPPRPVPEKKNPKGGPTEETEPPDETEGPQPSLDGYAEDYAKKVADLIIKSSNQLTRYSVSAVSILALVVIAVFLLDTIEGAFNDIWHVNQNRRFIYKFAVFWAVVSLGPLLIGASIYLSWRVDQWLAALRGINLISKALLAGLPFFISIFIFFLAYFYLPNARVRWTSALAGAIVAAVLWHLAKRGMYLYVVNVVPYSKIYGSLGLGLIFMLWLFLTWVIVLFGVEVSYTSQNLHALRYLDQRRKVHFNPLSERLTLRIALLAAKALLEGRGPLAVPDIAQQLGIAEDEIRPIADRLAATRLFTPVPLPGSPVGQDTQYVLAKAPETLTVRETLDSVREDTDWALTTCRPEEQQQLALLFHRMDDSVAPVLKDLTLASLLKQMQTE